MHVPSLTFIALGIAASVLPASLSAQGREALMIPPRQIPTSATAERLALGAQRPPRIEGSAEEAEPPIPESHRPYRGRTEVVIDTPRAASPPPLSLLYRDKVAASEVGRTDTYILPAHLRPDAGAKQVVQGDPKPQVPTPAQLAATYSQKGKH